MKPIPPRAFWGLFWSGRLSREEKRAILELADERDRLQAQNLRLMNQLGAKGPRIQLEAELARLRSGGQPVGTCRPGCIDECPGGSQDGNDSASDKLLKWQVRGLG